MRSNQLSYPAVVESECKDSGNFQTSKIFSQKIAKKLFSRPVASNLNPPHKNAPVMPLARKTFALISNTIGVVKVIAGAFLLVAISWEVITSDHVQLSPMYLTVQLVVCSIFLCDFVVRLSRADNRVRFFWRNLILLLISVPWLNIMVWSGMRPTHDWGLIVGLLPMLRAFLAMAFIVQWLVSDSKIQRLFIAYIFTVAVFTYISALVFYDYEIQVNPNLHNFGNALWWAWMNVTTVGAEIFPVTPIGKIFSVLLPSLGMMFFPIFTTYVLQEFSRSDDRDSSPGNGQGNDPGASR